MQLIIFLGILILIWQGAYWLGVEIFQTVKSYAVPSPLDVGKRFVELCSDGTLFQAIGNSLIRGIIGFVIAVIIGIILGLLLNHFKYLQKNLKPLVLGVQTLPSVCWVPFSILWFGLSNQAILFVVIMGSAFSIAISVDNAIKNVLPIYIKVARTMGASKQQIYTHVIFPACIPEWIVGLKQGWSFAWRALMAGEVMTTSIGLGQTLITGRDLADINQVTVVMLVIVIVGIFFDKYIFSIAEKKILRKRGLISENSYR